MRQVNHPIHLRLFDTSVHADQVVDHVLKDREASEQTLVNRAKVNLSMWTAHLMNHFGVVGFDDHGTHLQNCGA